MGRLGLEEGRFAWGRCGRLAFCCRGWGNVRIWKRLSAEVRWSRRSGTASDERSSNWKTQRVVLVRPPRVVRRREEDDSYLRTYRNLFILILLSVSGFEYEYEQSYSCRCN